MTLLKLKFPFINVFVFLIWLVIFIIRYQTGYQAEAKLSELVEKELQLTSRIASEPTLQGIHQSFKIGRVEVLTGQTPQYAYGQKLTISGTLKRQVISKWQDRFSLIYPAIKIINPEPPKTIRYWLVKKRQHLTTIFNKLLPEPEASLLNGLLLGTKQGLTQEFYQALKKTGTLHIVVASGYNVSLILGTIVFCLSGLIRRQKAIFLGIAAVWVYSVMIGLEPAIVRASLMGSLAFMGQLTGRQSAGFRLLIISAMVMLAISPLLIFDLGFILSFSATAGLILFGNRLGESLSAQIFTAPIIFYVFGQMNLFSILINSLILWLVPYAMILGAITAAFPLKTIAWLTYVPLTIIVRIISLFS